MPTMLGRSPGPPCFGRRTAGHRVLRRLRKEDLHLRDHPSEALSKWLAWARQHADALDPFSASNLHDLEAHAAILAKPKRGKMESDEKELRVLGLLDEYL